MDYPRGALCLLLLLIVAVTAGKNSRFRWKRPSYAMPWLKGPNVCAVEEVTGSRKRYYSECMTYMPRKICGKPTFIRYHCCTGFERTDKSAKGCEGVKPIENLMDTTKHLYLSELRKHAHASGMDKVLRHEGIFTLFAPHNNAFKQVTGDLSTKFSTTNLDNNLIKYHMTPGRKYLRSFYDNLILPSMLIENNYPALIKINRYSNGITTANCARIVLPDQIANNGILHTLEKAITPITNNMSLMQRLLEDDRFGEFVTAMIIVGLTSNLQDKTKDFTVFAPTDQAFRNAPPEVVDRILLHGHIRKKLLLYHILDQTICSAAILGLSRQRTMHGDKVNLTCDVNDNLRVNGIVVASKDNIGVNGVFHVIDELLIPPEAKSLGETLGDLGMYEFVEYAQGAGLTNVLRGSEAGNFTVFVPTPSAFKELTRSQKRMLQSQRAARNRVFNYHVVAGRYTTDDLVGEETLTTRSKGHKLRVKVYHQGFGINGAKIISANNVAFNGVVHIIDKILFPPEGTAMDRLQENADLSRFMTMLQTAGMDSVLRDPSGNFTVFAPNNDAFDAMDSKVLDNLLLNKQELEKFVKYHVLKYPVYPTSIKPKLRYRFKSLTKEWVNMQHETQEEPVVVNEDAKIKSEIESSNGVIYAIDNVLVCPCLESPWTVAGSENAITNE